MRKIRIDPMREIRRAVGKLERSKGKRIARRNARRALLRALNAAKKYYLEAHPCIDESGNEIRVKRERGLRCPVCNVPMGSVKIFCEHYFRSHNRGVLGPIKCPCGKSFVGLHNLQLRQFACHVRGLRDITTHFTLGALGRLGGSNGNGSQ